MTPRKHWDEYDVCVEWQTRVSDAALPFEARWTEAALRRIDPVLHARFRKQRELFNSALESGTIDKVIELGAATVRAYVAVVAAMEATGAPDDAYQIGRGPNGLTIAIGPKPCCARLQELYGNTVQWFSPDEIAAIIEMDARFKKLAEVKRAFPGAEMKG
ncbi:hypothetical protein [Bradyrhizobium sp. DASA03120]|uniref:hypothetical protein n=1 Tax=Bradyrhizobium sp. SMVTL-02 TaxID=3395917 RepID=UPI003F724361